jgi:hypothetical protein
MGVDALHSLQAKPLVISPIFNTLNKKSLKNSHFVASIKLQLVLAISGWENKYSSRRP